MTVASMRMYIAASAAGGLPLATAADRSNPTNAITGEVILKAMRQKQKARLKKERGLVLSWKDEHLRTLGGFGGYEPIF